MTDQDVRPRDVLTQRTKEIIDELPDRITEEDLGSLVAPINGSIRHHKDGVHLLRWTLAIIALRTKLNTPYGNKTERIKQLADRMNISWTALGIYMGAVQKLSYNTTLFDRFLRSGVEKHQYHIERLSQASVDPDVLGPEGLAEYVARKVRYATESMDALSGSDDGDVNGHVESASAVMTESAAALRNAAQNRGDGASEDAIVDVGDSTVDSNTGEVITENGRGVPEPFVDMVKECNCMACGAPGPSDPHHVEQGGWALKGSDWTVIPLCRTCHGIAEDKTPTRFREITGVDMGHAVARMLHIWVAGEDLAIPS